MRMNENIVLNDYEKQLIVQYLKPLLKKDDMVAVRKLVDNLFDLRINEKVANASYSIQRWLLQKLGLDYFKGADRTFTNEFVSTGITKIEIPGNVNQVGASSFYNCPLKEVKLNEGVHSILIEAFAGTDITSIILPASMEVVDKYAFADCKYLKEVRLLGNSPIHFRPGVFYNTRCNIVAPEDKEIVWFDSAYGNEYVTVNGKPIVEY